jgi:hypothetical protein
MSISLSFGSFSHKISGPSQVTFKTPSSHRWHLSS